MNKKILLIVLMVLVLPKLSFGVLKLSWMANTEERLAGYNVYICSTHENARKTIGDIKTLHVEKMANPSICIDIDLSGYKEYFIAVTAYDTVNNESESAILYSLPGNIYGNSYDDVLYRDAVVDGLDLGTLGFYFGRTVNHPTVNCDPSGFEIPDSTLKQLSDLNYDGQIDGKDLKEIGVNFGRRGQ